MIYSCAWCRAARLEAVAHQHLPIFHTEHCVFARFLSAGDSHLDCGRPCEMHALHLRDGGGADHLVLADEGCRNTVFNAQAQSGARAHSLPSLCLRKSGTVAGMQGGAVVAGHAWHSVQVKDDMSEQRKGVWKITGYKVWPCGALVHAVQARVSWKCPCTRHLDALNMHLRSVQGCCGTHDSTCILHSCAGVWHLPALAAASVGCFRVELVDEPAGQVAQILEAYRSALSAASPCVRARCVRMHACMTVWSRPGRHPCVCACPGVMVVLLPSQRARCGPVVWARAL